MRGQLLPEIQRNSYIDPEKGEDESRQPKKQRISYYRALSQLKDVNKKVTVVKNRLNFLMIKQQQSHSPLHAYFEDKQIKLRTIAHEDHHQLEEQLSLKRLKSQSEVEFKRRTNELHKRETLEKIDKARKMMIEEKYKCHDEVKQKSKENLKIIENFKHSFLIEKQSRRHLLYCTQKQQKQLIHQMQQLKINEIREQTEQQTRLICQKINQKEQQLKSIQAQCQQFQQHQRERIMKHRDRKMDKLKKRRLITIDTKSMEINKLSTNTTSPHSCVSFILIE